MSDLTASHGDRTSVSVAPSLRQVCARRAKQWLFGSGACSIVRAIAPSRNAAILRYHAITDPARCWYASAGICLHPDDFEGHVRYLARHYRVLPLPEITLALRSGRTLPPNVVALTFDDGYEDNLTAAQVLSRHGLTATFYLTAGCIGGELPFWPSEVRYLLSRITESASLGTGATSVHLTPGAEGKCTSNAPAVNRLFKSVPIAERERLRDQLRRLAGAPSLPSPMLTWDQVREMHALGMTIGSHTLTHPNLPSAGLIDAKREIMGAKERLEAEIGAPVTMFSYPNGGAERYETSEIRMLVRESGYHAATTSANGFASSRSDPFALERVQVWTALPELAFALEVERFAFKPGRRKALE